MSNTMKAILASDYGGPEVLVLGDTPRPEPQAGEVLIRLLDAGVNPADWKYRSGAYRQYMPLQFPWIPGLEGAGIIESVGDGVTDFQPGQAVYGGFMASYAEYAAVKTTDIDVKPSNVSFGEAAAITVGALTAVGAIDAAEVKAGQRVLVQGAAGGVGLFAVQLALLKGAYVIGTASAGNLDYVRSLGVSEAIDYKSSGLDALAKTIDVVIDTVGGSVIEQSLPLLKAGGILVTVAGMIAPDAGAAHGVRAISAGRAPLEKLKELSQLLTAGKLKSEVGTVYPLAQAKEAAEQSETGHGRGRILLHIADK